VATDQISTVRYREKLTVTIRKQSQTGSSKEIQSSRKQLAAGTDNTDRTVAGQITREREVNSIN